MDEYWETNANELIRVFRSALVQLIPVLNESRIVWKGENSYDDWDEIKKVLFRTIVANSIVNSNIYIGGNVLDFGTFPSEKDSLVITFESSDLGLEDNDIPILIDFESVYEPFDSVKYLIYSLFENKFHISILSTPYSECNFKITNTNRTGLMTYDSIIVSL